MKSIALLYAVAGLSSVANAGTLNNAVFTPMFGQSRPVSIFRVASDIAGPDAVRLEPEGMTWFNGDLYASGDAGAASPIAEANGFIARYVGGNLASAPLRMGQFNVLASVAGNLPVGPEGITVNTRGIGYGSFSGSNLSIVAVDGFSSPTGRILTTLNTTTNTTSGTVGSYPINSDDIAFVPGIPSDGSQDRFAVIDGSNGNNQMRFVSAADGRTALSFFSLPNQSKGLVYLPASEAAWFGFAQDAFLVAITPDFAGDTNKLNLYSITGVLLASEVLPTGNAASGLFHATESLAWNPATQQLFIGDENGMSSQIAVVTVPAPGVAALLGLGALAAGRRRRN